MGFAKGGIRPVDTGAVCGTQAGGGEAVLVEGNGWDKHGKPSAWSKAGHWRMGLLEAADWHGARWIGYDSLPDSLRTVPAIAGDWMPRWQGVQDVLPLFRKPFFVHKAIKSATAYVCGLGQFCLRLNGQKVGDHFLDPGWTKYDKHALYVAFELTGNCNWGPMYWDYAG